MKNNQKRADQIFPKYVRLLRTNGTKGTALRRTSIDKSGKSAWYFRDAGNWETKVRVTRLGIALTCDWSRDFKYLNNLKIQETTEEDWRKDNDGYVDKSRPIS